MTTGMTISRFDPVTDRDRLDALYDLYTAATVLDDPDGPQLARDGRYRLPVRGMMQGGRTYPGIWAQGGDLTQECWLATDDTGQVVGGYLIELPQHDYDTVLFAFPVVAPAARRLGIGTALLRHAAGRAPAGRNTLLAVAVTGSAGSSFATARGGRPASYDDIRRVLYLDDARPVSAPDDDYTFVGWDGPTPDEYVAGVVDVLTAMADAPRPGSMPPEAWTAARIRAAEEHQARRGTSSFCVAAYVTASGEFAALSELSIDPALPGWAFQGMTAVTRPHRGHRLGLRAKTTLMDRLRATRPDLRAVMTCNAATNTHMIAINEQLGFRPTLSMTTYEFTTGDLAA